jgi:serine phosphatase RsbU (regulator of sigma subunit)
VEAAGSGSAEVGGEIAVAILQPPGLTVAYANPAHTALFGWRTGDAPTPAAAAPAGEMLAAAAEVQRTGAPVQLPEVGAGERVLHIVCSPVRDQSTTFGESVVAVDITDQVRARRRVEDEHQRLSVLDEATAAVAAEIEPRREFIALADSVVPALADACAIYLIDHEPARIARGDTLQATRLVCVIDPALGVTPPAPEVRLQLAPQRTSAKAVRAGQPVLASGPAASPSGWGEAWLTRLDPHSLVTVPIGGPDAVLAVVKFVAVGNRPPYQDSDIALMRELTKRTATLVGRALRLQRTSEVALALQRGLLSDPPAVEGLEIRVRYRPAGPGMEIGGDWYDACLLPTGGLALTVGDVVGHDLHAASVMGQLRSMVQTLACQPGAAPAAVLSALNRLTTHLQVGEFATVVHGLLTPPTAAGAASFTWTNAGHPPPLLVGPGGPATILRQGASPLLGIPDAHYRQVSTVLPPGGTLLLYTDGLMEDPARPNSDTIAELAAAAGDQATAELDELCDKLIAAAPSRDDIALLAVRATS